MTHSGKKKIGKPLLFTHLVFDIMHISCEHLSKTFGNKHAVKDISIDIRPGTILALLGPNGAGKSTTIKMLTGQVKPTSGQIIIDGSSHPSLPEDIRWKLGIMPQEIIIWDDLTIQENLEFSASLYKIKKEEAAKQIAYLIEELKLTPELHTLAKNLSGGYKRRLNLAISVIHNPKVVFLDEPSPGIDAQSRHLLSSFIQHLAKEQNCAVVLTDHYLDEAEKLADYVVIVDHGSIVAEGTMQELKEKHSEKQNSTLEDIFLLLTGKEVRE